MSSKRVATANPAVVREWAQAEGLVPTEHKRGRLPASVVKAFNKAHGQKYVPAAYVETVEHTAKPAKGRSVTRKVNIADVRRACVAAGVEVGARGRLPKSVLDAFVLGTLGQKTEAPAETPAETEVSA